MYIYLLQKIVHTLMGWIFSLFCSKHRPFPPVQNPLFFISAHELSRQIRDRQIKSEDVVQTYINRIREVNPILNAVVDERFELALKEAREVDMLINSGMKTKDQIAKETPLLGVPITIKEHISVKGLHNTGGFVSKKNVVADIDATVVKLIKDAGAIILGVTNIPEFCSDWANSVNCIYGRTLNPYDTRRAAGGSSGGEGSIISAAGSVIGLGSDLIGSIRIPAMFNGIFGHKPTMGICSNEGIYPPVHNSITKFLTTGPMCRYATDMKLLMKIITGKNIKRLQLDKEILLKNLKYFYIEENPENWLVQPIEDEIKEAHKKAVKYLEKKFNIKVEKVQLKSLNRNFEMINTMRKVNFEKMLLETSNISLNFRTELWKWLFNKSQHTYGFLSIFILEKIIPPFKGKKLIKELKQCAIFREELEQMLGENGVLLYPTNPTTTMYHSQSFTQSFNILYAALFNVLGLPATHCPLGLSSEGLPLGIQIISKQYNDHLCLAVAEELENGFGGWVKPWK